MHDHTSPQTRYGINETMKALVAWATLQSMTSEWQEKRWFENLHEIHVNDEPPLRRTSARRSRRDSKIHVTDNYLYPNHGGEILTADIGEAPSEPRLLAAPTITGSLNPRQTLDEDLKITLRRFSKLVLAGYGGASLLFFGVPPIPNSIASTAGSGKQDEQANLAAAIDSAEEEATRTSANSHTTSSSSTPSPASYSWWDIFRGKHDKDILLRYAQDDPHSREVCCKQQ